MESKNKIISGTLELDVIQNSYGENYFVVELVNSEKKNFYKQIEDFLDKKVKITIQEIS